MKNNKLNIVLLIVSVLISLMSIMYYQQTMDFVTLVLKGVSSEEFVSRAAITVGFILCFLLVLIFSVSTTTSNVEDILEDLYLKPSDIETEDFVKLNSRIFARTILAMVCVITFPVVIGCPLFDVFTPANKVVLLAVLTINFIILFNISNNAAKRVIEKIKTDADKKS